MGDPRHGSSRIELRKGARQDGAEEEDEVASYVFSADLMVQLSPWLTNVPYLSPESMHKLPAIVNLILDKYPADFTWSNDFSPHFLVALIRQGFLTMATEVAESLPALLPKLHVERCVLRFQDMHVRKSTRKHAKQFEISMNNHFGLVVAGLREQHGHECWFYPPLVRALHEIFEKPERFDEPGQPFVRVHVTEVWKGENLVAGEIGCSAGSVYTSMSGFSRVSSAGSSQLAATAVLLERSGCTLWDLGMAIPYKMEMGAVNLPRRNFLRELRRGREGPALCFSHQKSRRNIRVVLDQGGQPDMASELLDAVVSASHPAAGHSSRGTGSASKRGGKPADACGANGIEQAGTVPDCRERQAEEPLEQQGQPLEQQGPHEHEPGKVEGLSIKRRKNKKKKKKK